MTPFINITIVLLIISCLAKKGKSEDMDYVKVNVRNATRNIPTQDGKPPSRSGNKNKVQIGPQLPWSEQNPFGYRKERHGSSDRQRLKTI